MPPTAAGQVRRRGVRAPPCRTADACPASRTQRQKMSDAQREAYERKKTTAPAVVNLQSTYFPHELLAPVQKDVGYEGVLAVHVTDRNHNAWLAVRAATSDTLHPPPPAHGDRRGRRQSYRPIAPAHARTRAAPSDRRRAAPSAPRAQNRTSYGGLGPFVGVVAHGMPYNTPFKNPGRFCNIRKGTDPLVLFAALKASVVRSLRPRATRRSPSSASAARPPSSTSSRRRAPSTRPSGRST